jgi:hypothetical protein
MEKEWVSARSSERRFAALMASVHAGDRMTAYTWFNQIEAKTAVSSNVEAQALPFQRWYRFKEAFSPRFVSTAIASLDRRPSSCVDPFGGSGTTALTCQFLGIRPVTIEVNPFLADLIEAKLHRYSVSALMRDYAQLRQTVQKFKGPTSHLVVNAPPTFVEPGVDGRWIFDRRIARRLLVFREAIGQIKSPDHQRLFRILLGSIAVRVSNVTISGKGRRYRSGWEGREVRTTIVDTAFYEAVENAIQDIVRFGRRAEHSYSLLRGDARKLVAEISPAEFALFSPPYPNSFDYTDIYNVELWLLGYLTSSDDNRTLREATSLPW